MAGVQRLVLAQPLVTMSQDPPLPPWDGEGATVQGTMHGAPCMGRRDAGKSIEIVWSESETSPFHVVMLGL